MDPYPTLAQIQSSVESGSLGLQIVFDTYTKATHDKCKRLYEKVMNREVAVDRSEEDLTNEVYVEIVLTMRETWRGNLPVFKQRLNQDHAAECVQSTAV